MRFLSVRLYRCNLWIFRILLLASWCGNSFADDACQAAGNFYAGSWFSGPYECGPYEADPWRYGSNWGTPTGPKASAAEAIADMNVRLNRLRLRGCSVDLGSFSDFTITNYERIGYSMASLKIDCPDWTTPGESEAVITRARDIHCTAGAILGLNGPGGRPTCIRRGTANLVIVSPQDQEQFNLTEEELTCTPAIVFKANPGSQNGSATVSWTANLEYQTSGGRGVYSNSAEFVTLGSAENTESYNSTGGRLTINASAVLSGSSRSATPRVIYITGAQIPDETITARLISIYNGSTQNLMTGIAMKESHYQQFATRTLYGISASWPNESYDGGSHVGLMQMPITQAHAWNWHTNTQGAIDLFSEKLRIARTREGTLRARHPGLRELSGVERENMALLLYGPESSNNLSRQYYIPERNSRNSWEWSVNTAGNADGIAYANSVRLQLQ